MNNVKMSGGKAIGIFHDIDSQKYSEDEKVTAIHHCLFETSPQLKKTAIADVARWLYQKRYGDA